MNKVFNVIGCGATGGEIVRQLVKQSIHGENPIVINVYDFDVVEPHNLQNQVYDPFDTLKLKTTALIEKYKHYEQVKIIDKGKYITKKGIMFEGEIFICVDSIELTKEILEDIIEFSPTNFVCHTRISAREAQVYYLRAEKLINYCGFKDDETVDEVSVCGTRVNVLQTAVYASTTAVDMVCNNKHKEEEINSENNKKNTIVFINTEGCIKTNIIKIKE